MVAPLPEAAPGKGGGRVLLGGARRNLAAAGAGALLVAVLGTVVTLGLTAGDPEEPGSRNVTTEQSSPESTPDDGFPDDEPGDVPVPTGGTPGGETSATPSASEPATPAPPARPPGPVVAGFLVTGYGGSVERAEQHIGDAQPDQDLARAVAVRDRPEPDAQRVRAGADPADGDPHGDPGPAEHLHLRQRPRRIGQRQRQCQRHGQQRAPGRGRRADRSGGLTHGSRVPR